MSTSNSLRRAVRYALLTSVAAGASVPAFAAQEQTIQEVVVTGSRIAQPNLETTSPVTQVTAARSSRVRPYNGHLGVHLSECRPRAANYARTRIRLCGVRGGRPLPGCTQPWNQSSTLGGNKRSNSFLTTP
jgi:hypothetical protein